MSDSREEFEAVALRFGFSLKMRCPESEDGEYLNINEQDYWNIWQLACEWQASAVVPEGYSLVPSTMVLDYESFELIKMITGDGETEDDFSECTLWVGELVDDDGEPDAYGLNIACSECMEEGSITVVEFPRPTTSTIPKLS
jgi:hypothetical protein